MRTLVIGLGNPILSDDGVGVKVAYAVSAQYLQDEHLPGLRRRQDDALASAGRNDVTITEASVGGLGLMELMVGYNRVILIDAIQTPGGQPGNIHRLTLDDIAVAMPTRHSASAHDMNLPTALEMGRRLGLALPEIVEIFAIEAEDVVTFGEICTPIVAAAIPIVTEMVLRALAPSSEAAIIK